MGKLSQAWKQTPWGKVWAAALIVMIGAFVGALVDGLSVRSAVIFAVLCGPGFLAFATVASLFICFASPQSD
jgi:uncharacterized membrane protein YccC